MRFALGQLMLFLVIGSATGAFAAIAEAEGGCDEGCGEGDEECCPLVCPRCVCSARGVTLDVPQAVALPGTEELLWVDLAGDAVEPESADADEILHVPIAAS